MEDRRSPSRLSEQVTNSGNSLNKLSRRKSNNGEDEMGGGRKYANCTSTSHNSRKYFSLANGLILILILLLCWTTSVHGGFPGRGPPPRGPPLMPHHPLAGINPFRRRPPPPHHHHGPANRRNGGPFRSGDLHVAAQTLYDLRGFGNFPLSGPENPRFHRQNDPFTLPTPLAPNQRQNHPHPHISTDTRQAPLVFPSFYQEQPTPNPTRSTIFGHNQHLSQTRFEPPPGFHLGGNSASGKITLEQQSASSRDQFRPSQIDISLHSNQVTPSPSPFGPQAQSSTIAPEKKSLASTVRPRTTTVKLNKNQDDPFVYVYDEVDYDEGDEDFNLSRHRAPQGQINNNRITPATSTTTVAPLRAREPTIVPQFPTLNYHQPQHQALFTSTTSKPTTTQNSLYYSPQKDDFNNPFRDPTSVIRPPVTPRPNVEIVPSSERKPPPDQSNAIAPALHHRFPQSTIRDFSRPIPPHQQISEVVSLRRPQTTTTTTASPPPTFAPHYQRDTVFPHVQQYQQPQGRQVNSPAPAQGPIAYFPAGLDRRPFETTNDIPSIQTKNQFDQVVNLLQEEDEEYHQNNVQQNLQDQNFNNPSKLRPVNTLVPKNRIPTEDIILPPNFPFTHAQDLTTPLIPVGQDRPTTQQRIRDQTTRIREELPRVPQRNQQRRPENEDEIDENNVVNQHHSQVTPSPGRTRGRQPQRTTVPPAEVPQRGRTPSARQRLRPNGRQTTTTTTTPVPTYVEYPSQEYLDDYDNSQYQSPAPPAQVLSPVTPSRFPPFPKKQEGTTAPPPRQRPTIRQRPGKNRFRETTTPDAGTSPRTTGKPLYTTGKMLSKEGGLYAGQMITLSHIYGQPVPNVPINGVLDKIPGVIDGKQVTFATAKPNFASPQKHLRSKQRFQEHGPPSRINPSANRVRPNTKTVHENGLEIVETVTLRPFTESKEEPKRLRAGSQFVRGSSQQQSTEDGQQVLPRRRKRPGQRLRPLQQQQAEAFPESIQKEEDDSSFQTERAQILRESPAVESTTANSLTPSPRSRRPRPRPGKVIDVPVNEKREREDDSRNIEQPQPQTQKVVRKLRPRLRPVPTSQLQQQQSQSAQVDRKPTDAPGRFSSRFREQDNFDSSTVSTLRGDDRETSSTSPGRFSPPTSRPTFKPPPPKKPLPGQRKVRPQQPHSGEKDADSLPESIKLSPKDVIENRKPARRIPPGSVSDRLKALQQRRNKVFGQHGEEQTAEGRQVPVTKRPRLMKPVLQQQNQNQEDDDLPQPQRLRRPNQASPEATGSKREILPRNKPKAKNEVDYYNEENDQLREEVEDEEEYEEGSASPAPQSVIASVVSSRPRNSGFHRNRSVEVTSDEARSVLGIPRPAAPSRSPPGKRLRFQKKYQYEDEEAEEADEAQEEQPQQEEEVEDDRPRLQSNPPRLKLRQSNERIKGDGGERQNSREVQTNLPERPQSRQVSRERGQQRQSQERIRQQEEEEQEEEKEDYADDKEEPPRKPFLKKQQPRLSSHSPSSFQKVYRNKKVENARSRQVEDEDEIQDNPEEEEETPSSERTITTTSTSTSSSSSTSTSTSPSEDGEELPPVALPIKGPQPIKQNMLKARLRANRQRIQKQQQDKQEQSSRVTVITTTQATITEEKPNRPSKSLRPRLNPGGGGGKRNSKKFIAMATENPSLPLESIFPEV